MRSDIPFAVAAAVALGLYLSLSRGVTFFHDEWSFLTHRDDWTLEILMAPHNEHWSLVLAAVYKALLSIFGLQTYVPYLFVLLLLHLSTAAGIYALLKANSGVVIAFLAGTLFLFLGTGHENLFWAFQMGFVGAAAAGTWAMVLVLVHPTPWGLRGASLLLLIAVATVGIGLVFFLVAAALLLLEPRRRVHAWVLAPAVIAYAAWYMSFGRTAASANRDPFTLEAIGQVQNYVVAGVSNAIGVISGFGPGFGLAAFVVLAAATVWHLTGRSALRTLAVAGLIGLVAQFALTGLVRAQFGEAQATSSRYIYVSAVFTLLLLAGLLGRRLVGSGMRGYAPVWFLWALAMFVNVPAVWMGSELFQAHGLRTRAAISVILTHGGTPSMSASEGIFPIPGRDRLTELFLKHGSPEDDVLLSPEESPLPLLLDEFLFLQVADSLTVTEGELPRPPAATEIVESADLVVTPIGDCVELRAVGEDPRAILEIPSGLAVGYESDVGDEVQLFLALYDVHTEANSLRFTAKPRQPYRITTPAVGGEATWRVRIDPPTDSTSQVCRGGRNTVD